MTVVIVGGGIGGLAAAWDLAGAGEHVVVLEASDRVGGKLATGTVGGVDIDLGAESVLARRPEAVDLIAAAGLERVSPVTTAAYVRAGGALHPLPARTMLGIPADLAAVRASGALSYHAVGRIEDEPSQPPLAPLASDVAVGALVRERLGNEVADRLVEPLLGGVYAGRADAISLQASMPAVFQALNAGGSLVRAAQSVVPAPDPSAGPVFASARGGLGALPRALAASGRFDVRTGTTARAIRRTPTGFAVETGPVPEPAVIECDRVIVATPPAKAARLLRDLAPAAAAELAAIGSASVALVSFAFGALDLPGGSGLLVGAREGLAVKGVTVSSQKWALDTDLTVLRASLGRAGDEVVLQRSDEELITLARHDLQLLLGISDRPVDAVVTRWGGGLPQYAVGHVDRVGRIRAAVADVPGLAVCGAAYDGVGVPAVIASARLAAHQVRAQ